jgi:predicted DCC family thiol-disulfide oxidoreductase YuxK
LGNEPLTVSFLLMNDHNKIKSLLGGGFMKNIILFDGVCNFCNQSVQFIIKRDPKGIFQFASLQSEVAHKLIKRYGINENIDSFVLISDDTFFVKSNAALKVCRKLNGIWKWLYVCYAVPRPIRDFFYDIIAKNRYKWFGKNDHCLLPSQDIRNRFLD